MLSRMVRRICYKCCVSKSPEKSAELQNAERALALRKSPGISSGEVARNAPESYEERLFRHCRQLLNLITGIQKAYRETANDDEKRFIETTIGAAIYYLPHEHNRLWSGFVSETAINEHHPENESLKPRLTKDHYYARKRAARDLLKSEWQNDEQSVKKIMQLFQDKFGRFHYVTPTENSRLKQHQEGDDATPDEAYKAAGIKLTKVDPKLLSAIRRRDKNAIRQLLKGQ
jgi:hypothetical protein